MNEAQFWTFIRKKLNKIPGLKYDRIESHLTSGIPDVTYSYGGRHGWIELKVLVSRRDHLTMAQRMWLNERHKTGGNVWLWFLYGTGPGFGIFAGNVLEQAVPLSSKTPLDLTLCSYWTESYLDLSAEDLVGVICT